MKVMVFDFESSDIPKWNLPSEHPDQPHICQFTGVLFDDEADEELAYVDMIIRQDGWSVAPGAFATHGITRERSMEEGYPEEHSVRHFEAMLQACDRLVGFSIDFDIRIARIALMRFDRDPAYVDQIAERIKAIKFDVMRQATPLAKIPPTDKMMATGRKTWKSPTLVEAMKAIMGIDMPAAHDSRGDVHATKQLYQHLNLVRK